MKTLRQLLETVMLIESLDQILSQSGERIRSNLVRDNVPHEPGKHVEHFKKTIEDLPQHHQTWIAKRYANKSIQRFEDIGSRIVPALKKFDDLVGRGIAKPETLSKWNNPDALENFVRKHTPEEDIPEVDPSEYEKHAENEHWVIHVPHTENASCALGHGTNWCTASRSNSMFNSYNEKGPLYVITPKKPQYKGEKYQFHPMGQFMNEQDRSDTKLLKGPEAIADKPAFKDRPLPGAVGAYASLERLDVLDSENDSKPRVTAKLKEMMSSKMTRDEQTGLAHYLHSTVLRGPNAHAADGHDAFDEGTMRQHQKARNEAVKLLISDPSVHSEAKGYILPVAMKHIYDYNAAIEDKKLELEMQESHKRAGWRNVTPKEAQLRDEVIDRMKTKIGHFLGKELELRRATKSAIEDLNAHPRLLAAAISTEGVQIPKHGRDSYTRANTLARGLLFPNFGVTERILNQREIHPILQHSIADFSGEGLENRIFGHPDNPDSKEKIAAVHRHVERLGNHPSLLPSTLRKLASHEREMHFSFNDGWPHPEIPRFTKRILQQPHLSVQDQFAIGPMNDFTYGRYYGDRDRRNLVIGELAKRDLHPDVLKRILQSHMRNDEPPHPGIVRQMSHHIRTADTVDNETERHVIDTYNYLIGKDSVRTKPYTDMFQSLIYRKNPSDYVLNRIDNISIEDGWYPNTSERHQAYHLHPTHGPRIMELKQMAKMRGTKENK